jgi:hypothetical protein
LNEGYDYGLENEDMIVISSSASPKIPDSYEGFGKSGILLMYI